MQQRRFSRSQHRVDWAPHPRWTTVQHVGVDLPRAHVAVAQELLHRPDVATVFEQMRRERMAERVWSRSLGDPGAVHGVRDDFLEHRLVQVVPADLTRGLLPIETRGREDPVPGPLAAGARVLAIEGPRQLHRTSRSGEPSCRENSARPGQAQESPNRYK